MDRRTEIEVGKELTQMVVREGVERRLAVERRQNKRDDEHKDSRYDLTCAVESVS